MITLLGFPCLKHHNHEKAQNLLSLLPMHFYMLPGCRHLSRPHRRPYVEHYKPSASSFFFRTVASPYNEIKKRRNIYDWTGLIFLSFGMKCVCISIVTIVVGSYNRMSRIYRCPKLTQQPLLEMIIFAPRREFSAYNTHQG